MANCRRCSAQLPGRRQLCDSCKANRPGTADTVKARKSKPKRSTKPADQAPAPVEVEIPEGLHKRGRALWLDLGAEEDTALGAVALEICRSADRLNELDRIIAGKGVMQLMRFRLGDSTFDRQGDEHITVEVSFGSVLSEARGQQTSLREMLKQFHALRAAAKAASSGGSQPEKPASDPVASGLDEVSARRAAREHAAGGA